jgi:predicted enzyme related to lactoylglutathione lyase
MASRISHTSFDALNSYAQSRFWGEVLGWVENPDDPNLPEHEECMIHAPDGSARLLFVQVPDAKQLKNRVHLDTQPTDGTREEEMERVITLGASFVADFRNDTGGGWVVMVDPEGNEFCILSRDWHPTPFPPRV